MIQKKSQEKKTEAPKKRGRPKKVVEAPKVMEKPAKAHKPKMVKSDTNEALAVSCCSTLKSSIAHSEYKDWEEIGFGERTKHWFQIKGLMKGNNIAISKEDVGRKKKYTVYVVSKQGTDITAEFTDFSYTHRNNTLTIVFSKEGMEIKHTVKYGEENE